MNTRQRSLMLGAGACLLVAVAVCWLLATGTSVQADPPGSEYQFFIGAEVNLANTGFPFDFPDTRTMAADGSILVLSGGGTFTLGPGKSIGGGGTYAIILDDTETAAGTWETTQLESFQTYGSSPVLPEEFEAGRMNAKIEVEGMGAARLTVWCRLPGVKIPNPVPEGIRVDFGDLHFDDGDNAPGEMDATLFIRESD